MLNFRFLAGFLQILNPDSSNNERPVEGFDYLGQVVGLVRLGEFDEAREQTNVLILSRLGESFFNLSSNIVPESLLEEVMSSVRIAISSIRQALSESYLHLVKPL